MGLTGVIGVREDRETSNLCGEGLGMQTENPEEDLLW